MRARLPIGTVTAFAATALLATAPASVGAEDAASRSSTTTEADCERITDGNRTDCEKRARERTRVSEADRSRSSSEQSRRERAAEREWNRTDESQTTSMAAGQAQRDAGPSDDPRPTHEGDDREDMLEGAEEEEEE